jgi:signal transduction histidine kinase
MDQEHRQPRKDLFESWVAPLMDSPRGKVLGISAGIISGIALLDSFIEPNVSLGFLYTIPIMIAAPHLVRWQVALLAAICTGLREWLSPFVGDPHMESRLLSTYLGLGGVGFLAHQVALTRFRTLRAMRELAEEARSRQEAEAQLRSLVEGSPLAIVTLDGEGRVEMCNQAAEALLAPAGPLVGQAVGRYLPTLAEAVQSGIQSRRYRTVMHMRGQRGNGQRFMAGVWFATYPARGGERVAAMLSDTSDEMRDWQEASLQHMLTNTRVLMGSVAHEIRNFCAAIQMVSNNLARSANTKSSADLEALASLVDALQRIATVELRSAAEADPGRVALADVLGELRIILEPAAAEAGCALQWDVPEDLPYVTGEHYNLLQVFLNLTRNSLRVMEGRPERILTLGVRQADEGVEVYVRDTGPGIRNPAILFRAFQPEADLTGLGLFVSRALVRACDGELYHEPTGTGCSMVVRLQPQVAEEADGSRECEEVRG